MSVKFTQPTEEAINFIAENMRDGDLVEVLASGIFTDPLTALKYAVDNSDYSILVTDEHDTPLALYGIAIRRGVTGLGVPWLLSSAHALDHKREFLLNTPTVIKGMLDLCPRLVNYVHVENRISIRWLKWLGFTIEKPVKNKLGEEFCRFSKEV